MGSIGNGASLRLIHNLSLILTCFNRAESLHHNLSVIFHFCTCMRKIDEILSITYVYQSVCKLYFSSKISQQLLGLGFRNLVQSWIVMSCIE